MRIVFMGTPEFAVPSLEILLEHDYDIVGVVTSPDKPAGRGLKLSASAVKKYAEARGLNILQPEKLKDPVFLHELRLLDAGLQVVVAFRMLPEVVWKMPPLGTFNLHASLLPRYRGAAPINWAIINGEEKTGVTTFFLQHEIDSGDILYNEEVPIGPDTTAGELHDELMETGARLVLKTVKAIEKGEAKPRPQSREDIILAPKIFRDNCQVDWTKSVQQVHNLIRGLSPWPGAFTSWGEKNMKILSSKAELAKHDIAIGKVLTDNKSYIKVAVPEGFIHLLEVQPEGKKPMPVKAFLAGNRVGMEELKIARG